MTTRLSEDKAVAQLLIDAGIGDDPEVEPVGPMPVLIGETFNDGLPFIGVHGGNEGRNEGRNHTGRMLSKPAIHIEAHALTHVAAYALGERLQAFCDSPAQRVANREGCTLAVNTLQRTGGVRMLGEHPKTHLFVVSVTVEVSASSIDPVPAE